MYVLEIIKILSVLLHLLCLFYNLLCFIDSYARLHGSLWEENFYITELIKSMRQKEDQDFAQLLMRVRTAECTQDDRTLLKSRVISKKENKYPSEVLHVFKTNKEVDEHNSEHLKKLPTQVFHIKAIDKKKRYSDRSH